MTIAPARFYRDPLELLEWAERNSCKGCIHKTKVLGADACGHPNAPGKPRRAARSTTTGRVIDDRSI
jgi:hypothetical protein